MLCEFARARAAPPTFYLAPSQRDVARAALWRRPGAVARHGVRQLRQDGCAGISEQPEGVQPVPRCALLQRSAACSAAAWPGHKKACKARAAEREAETTPVVVK